MTLEDDKLGIAKEGVPSRRLADVGRQRNCCRYPHRCRTGVSFALYREPDWLPRRSIATPPCTVIVDVSNYIDT